MELVEQVDNAHSSEIFRDTDGQEMGFVPTASTPTMAMPGTLPQVQADATNSAPLLAPAANNSDSAIHPSLEPSIQLSLSAIHPAIHPVVHPSNHPSIHTPGLPSDRSSLQPSIQPSTLNLDYSPLTPARGKVLIFLMENCTGATNVDLISYGTQVPIGTVKDGLRALKKTEYLIKTWRISRADFHGFGYLLNHQICTDYVAKVYASPQSSIHPSAVKTDHPRTQPFVHPSALLSSSSLKDFPKTLTTTQSDIDWNHAELAFWVEAGLNTKTVNQWAEEFGIPIDLMIQALKHAAYDLPLQEERRKEKIDAFNWFYSALKRFGTYRRPLGYKPIELIILEEIAAEREEKEKLARELAEERERSRTATAELKFQKILSDPTSDAYKELKDKVSPAGSMQLRGKMLETAMREMFFNLLTSSEDVDE